MVYGPVFFSRTVDAYHLKRLPMKLSFLVLKWSGQKRQKLVFLPSHITLFNVNESCIIYNINLMTIHGSYQRVN